MIADARFLIASAVILITAGLDVMVFVMLVHHPEASKDVYAFAGVITGGWFTVGLGGAVGYWLGSSRGSQAKDETIAQLTKTSLPFSSTPPSHIPGPSSAAPQ